jgi:Spx/MgsR family transcriptional regulator
VTPRLYGIRNCDTVKRALAWFEERGIAVEFVDYKKTPPSRSLLDGWLRRVDHGRLVNRAGTTWRKLPDDARAAAETTAGALALMIEKPSVIRRPVIETDGTLLVGYDPDLYAKTFHG